MIGAVVKWNDRINGRQFDVTVRFEHGPYQYLTVIECKNYTSAVKAEKVESLVTKATDVGADKAVMFSARGFQSGAIDVARTHGVPLFSLSQATEIPDEMLAPDAVEYVQIFAIVLVRADGLRYPLPDDSMKLTYYLNKTIIQHPLGNVTLSRLVDMHENRLAGRAVDDVLPYGVDFDPPGRVVFPNTEPIEPMFVRSIWWKMVNRVGRPLKHETGLDPALFVMPYEIKDELTGTVRYAEGNGLNYVDNAIRDSPWKVL